MPTVFFINYVRGEATKHFTHPRQRVDLLHLVVHVVIRPLLNEVVVEQLEEPVEGGLDGLVGGRRQLPVLPQPVELDLQHGARILLGALLKLDTVPTVKPAVHLTEAGEAKRKEGPVRHFIPARRSEEVASPAVVAALVLPLPLQHPLPLENGRCHPHGRLDRARQ